MRIFERLAEVLNSGKVEGVPLEDLRKLRTEVRKAEFSNIHKDLGWKKWNSGGCHIISEELEGIYGWERDGGCYVTDSGSHVAHYWNILPDGRIIDVTADQFEDGDDIRITHRKDVRYLTECDCSGQIGTKYDKGQFVPRNDRGEWRDV